MSRKKDHSYHQWITFLLVFLVTISLGFTQIQTVYVTETGKKYHMDQCRYLKYSKIEISLKNAMVKEYTACSVRKPPVKLREDPPQDSVKQVPEGKGSQVKKAVTTRCTATTQAGTRCKRMTREASGKCWQH